MIKELLFLLSVLGHVYTDCGVVSKDEWGGLSHVKLKHLPRPLGLVIIQHTASPSCSTNSGCEESVRNIQNYHMEILKYWDIGPSFLIGGNGKVYEGTGWHRVGAHTFGYNTKSIAISFIGNFENEKPTQASLNAAKSLIECGVEKGHLKSDYKLVAHRQLIAIASPGRHLYNEIRKWPDWTSDVSDIKNKS